VAEDGTWAPTGWRGYSIRAGGGLLEAPLSALDAVRVP